MAIFERLCVAAGLQAPVREYRFHPRRRWRFDYCFPEAKVALEIEGGAFTRGRHTRGQGFIADLEKYSEAAIAGWCVVRVTPGDLLTKGIDLVTRAHAQRATEARDVQH